MSDLTFPTAPTNAQPEKLRVIDSGSFWPTIDLNHLRQAARIDNTITAERLHETAIEAVAYVNQQLAQIMRIRSQLARADDMIINGESIRIHRYRRAVYCYTKALLLESYADYDATGKQPSAPPPNKTRRRTIAEKGTMLSPPCSTAPASTAN